MARSEAAVLITGENGSGKEVVARNLHLLSDRSGGPFIKVVRTIDRAGRLIPAASVSVHAATSSSAS